MKPQRNWAVYQEKEDHGWTIVCLDTADYVSRLVKEYIKSGWKVTLDKRHIQFLDIETVLDDICLVRNKLEILYKDSTGESYYIVWLLLPDTDLLKIENTITVENTELD
jgi:hypothetical protein